MDHLTCFDNNQNKVWGKFGYTDNEVREAQHKSQMIFHDINKH